MTVPYKQGILPDDLAQLPDALRREFASLKRALEEPQSIYELAISYSYPARLRVGMVIYADGTTLNPGSGEGLYRYNLAGFWVFLG